MDRKKLLLAEPRLAGGSLDRQRTGRLAVGQIQLGGRGSAGPCSWRSRALFPALLRLAQGIGANARCSGNRLSSEPAAFSSASSPSHMEPPPRLLRGGSYTFLVAALFFHGSPRRY
jgi:hypothetical protein